MSRAKATAITFHVGQRVVCIDASPNPQCDKKTLTRGKIYVIRAIDTLPGWKPPGWGVHLEGVRIFYPGNCVPWAFHPNRFRPVIDRPTNIEVFKRLLAAVPTEIGRLNNPAPQEIAYLTRKPPEQLSLPLPAHESKPRQAKPAPKKRSRDGFDRDSGGSRNEPGRRGGRTPSRP
jgi:hypothetical protein